MSNAITVTVRGFCGTTPVVRTGADSSRPWAQFRLASTPSSRDAQGVWRDGETVWVTVKTFGTLAANVGESLRKSDPVVVVGRLRTETWRGDDGEERSTLTVVADAVGHDLGLGVTSFRRVLHGAGGAGRVGVVEGVPDDTTARSFEVEEAQPAAV